LKYSIAKRSICRQQAGKKMQDKSAEISK